jgi:hypothetical protein
MVFFLSESMNSNPVPKAPICSQRMLFCSAKLLPGADYFLPTFSGDWSLGSTINEMNVGERKGGKRYNSQPRGNSCISHMP